MSLDQQFVDALVFCLKQDRHIGDLEAMARWALSNDPDLQPPGDPEMDVALVFGGATKIKGYVFESSRLQEIRGASGLLDRVNLVDTRFLWRSQLSDDGFEGEKCIIYANGGEVLAFAPVSKASHLAERLEQLYTEETMIAQSVAVWRRFSLKQLNGGLLGGEQVDQALIAKLLGYNPGVNKTFGSLVAALALDKLRRREANSEDTRSPRSLAHIETMPFERRCSSCERRSSVVNARVAKNEDRPLCEPCARKRIFGQLTKRKDVDRGWWDDARFKWQPEENGREPQSWADKFEAWLDGFPDVRNKYAVDLAGEPLTSARSLKAVRDLGEIAQVSQPQGFIGVVYADGNNMGELLERLKTPSDYSRFANEVHHAIQDAVFVALTNNLHPTSIQRESAGEVFVHPFEILSIGGDDLLLIVPAHVALPIASDIASTVERRLVSASPMFLALNSDGSDAKYNWADAQRCREQTPNKQCKVSLSAGVVIADAHTPVFYLEELASQLLKTAKRRAKWLKRECNYYGGTIDFLSLKSVTTIRGTIEQFRDSALAKGNRRLYARPYTILELAQLLKTVRLLKHAKFPRNQLYRLRESMHEGAQRSTIDYRYFLSRDPEVRETRRAIEQMWETENARRSLHPWIEQIEENHAYETFWLDVVELYDFVPLEEIENAEG